MKLIYLDNSATTKPFKTVVDVMGYNLENDYFNPSAGYRHGIEAGKKIQEARETIAKVLGCESREFIFTSGGTESINTAINCAIELSKKKHIISSTIEHDATLKTLEAVEKKDYHVSYLKPEKDGSVSWEQVEKAITDDTFLVSLMQVNNELGSITRVEEIGQRLSQRNILFHVDGVQGFLKQGINVKTSKISMFSISGHKVNGPKGVGGLYISKDVKFSPFIYGGGQEFGFRSGTENFSGIVGFGEAVRINSNNFEVNKLHYKELKAKLVELLKKKIEDFTINSPDNGADNILNLSILGVKSEVLLNSLAERHILISSGSACSSKKKTSHVLEGINLSKELREGAIRVSLGVENTKEEIIEFVNVLEKEVEDIRRFTKYKKVGRQCITR